jgi:hypothetical protein
MSAPAARTIMTPFDARSPIALVALVVVLVGSAVGFRVAAGMLSVYLSKEPVELRVHFDTIPRRLGEWSAEGESRKFDAAMEEELGTDLYLDRSYINPGDPEAPMLMLHLAYYTGMIDAVPHVPDRCLVAGGLDAEARPVNIPLVIDTSGWSESTAAVNNATGLPYPSVSRIDPVTRRPIEILMPIGDVALRTSEFRSTQNPGVSIWAGYFFVANGRIAVTPEQVKALAFQPSEKYAYYCKVQFLAQGQDLTREQFIEAAESLLEPLLPELMTCLPDWAAVERGEVGGTDGTT